MKKTLKRIILITSLILLAACHTNSDKNESVHVRDNSEILELSYKICALKTYRSQLDGRMVWAKTYRKPQSTIDSIKLEEKLVYDLLNNYSLQFENLIFYENHDPPFTSLNYAQYYYSQLFYEKSDKFSLLKDQDSIFENLDYKKSRFFLMEQIIPGDTTQFYFVSRATKMVAEKLEINWDDLSIAHKNELNMIVDAKIMVANYDFFPSTSQNKPNNCGAACMKMICDFYGNYKSLSEWDSLTHTSDTGASFNDLIRAGKKLNLDYKRLEINYTELCELNQLPLIANWNDNHFIVVYKIDSLNAWVADPAKGLRQYSKQDFCNSWMYSSGKPQEFGRAVSFTPNEAFYYE